MVAMTRFHGLLRRAVKSCYLLHKISLQPLRGTKPYHPVFPAHFDLRICYLPPYYLLAFLCQPRPVYSTAVSYYSSRVRQDLNLHTASATSANLLCQLSYVLVFRLSPDHFVLWTFASISSAKIISSTSPACFINTIKKSPLFSKKPPANAKSNIKICNQHHAGNHRLQTRLERNLLSLAADNHSAPSNHVHAHIAHHSYDFVGFLYPNEP